MIGSFLTRGLVMIFGYVYPAYECFKTLERNKPDIEQLRFWCQYWILVAVMTVMERVSDAFVSWVPMYSEAKLAFIIYLWYPRTKGTTYVYDSFFKPYVSKHETEIDRNLLELRTRAGDMAFMYCQKAASYGQTRIFEVLQYVAAQSTPRPRPTQPQQATRTRQPPSNPPASATAAAAVTAAAAATAASAATAVAPAAALVQPATKVQSTTQVHDEQPLSPTSSTSSSRELETEEELSSSKDISSTPAPPSPAQMNPKKSLSLPHGPESSSQSVTNNAEAKQIIKVPSKAEKSPAKGPPSPEETVMEETIRVTRGRLRKTRSTVTK
ncbi:HVA22-like protein i [Amaranthus tricolor]|uniref:HVA22-like protein i n=1 Tax=Amaranthus tricolor TaxID=29722 RepID=UPI00258C0A42|nr:HVA22-like protein i [Amaranthus tricolor]